MKEMIYSANSIQEVLHNGEYKGYKFCILNLGTHPTAYVECKIENCNGYEDERLDDISVHGGFTYFGKGFWDKESSYLGWDYAHYMDYAGYELMYPESMRSFGKKKWTTAEIFEEVKAVIDQLINAYPTEKGGLRMREILFRGKRVDNGGWVVGLVVKDFECYRQKYEHIYIVTHEHPRGCFGSDIYIEVIPETVGQYTGKTVKTGKVFEGDIGKSMDGVFFVRWNEEKSAFVMDFYDYPYEELYLEEMWDDSEIIGNIHDNPELLKGGAE